MEDPFNELDEQKADKPATEPAWLKSATYERSSPSQLKTYIECNRKWWYENVRKLRKPPTVAQARGTALHAICEHVLETGEMPELARVRAMLAEGVREEDKDQPLVFEVTEETLPKLVWMLTNSFEFLHQVRAKYTEVQIEGEFLDTDFPVPVKGFSDFVAHSTTSGVITVGKGTKLFRHEVAAYEMLVGDHKSTSDWKYVKDEEALRHDPQAIVYCHHFLKKLETAGKRVDRIRFLHHYILTSERTKKSPDPRFTVIEFTRDELAEGVAQISATLQEMNTDYQKSELDVSRNADSCGMYGGCPHVDYCEEKDVNDFMKSLLQGAHAVTNTTPTPAPVEPPTELLTVMAPVSETPAEQPAASQPEPEPPARIAPQPGGPLKLILIDCVHVSKHGISLETFLKPISDKWAEVEKIKHYTLERFSNGARAIVYLGLTPELPDILEVDTRTRLGGEFLTYLNEYAARNPGHVIIKGSR